MFFLTVTIAYLKKYTLKEHKVMGHYTKKNPIFKLCCTRYHINIISYKSYVNYK